MNNTMNIWGTTVEQGLTVTVELYVAFTAVAGVQDIEAAEAVEKQFDGEMFSDSEWATL
jgi:hypothetical protein